MTSLAIMGLLPPENAEVSGEVMFEGRDLLTSRRPSLRDLRGNRTRDDLPGADDLAQPGFTIGDQIVEAILRHRGV